MEERIREQLRQYLAALIGKEVDDVQDSAVDALFGELVEQFGGDEEGLRGIEVSLTVFEGPVADFLTAKGADEVFIETIEIPAERTQRNREAVLSALIRAGRLPSDFSEAFLTALTKAASDLGVLKDAAQANQPDVDLTGEELDLIADRIVSDLPSNEDIESAFVESERASENSVLQVMRALAAEGKLPANITEAVMREIRQLASDFTTEVNRAIAAEDDLSREDILATLVTDFDAADAADVARQAEIAETPTLDTFLEAAAQTGRTTETPGPDELALLDQAFGLAQTEFRIRTANGEDVTFREVSAEVIGGLPSREEITRQIESRFGQLPPGFNPVQAATAAITQVNQRIGQDEQDFGADIRTADEAITARADELGVPVEAAQDDPAIIEAQGRIDTLRSQMQNREADLRVGTILRDSPELSTAFATGDATRFTAEFDRLNPGVRGGPDRTQAAAFDELLAAQSRQFPGAPSIDIGQLPTGQTRLGATTQRLGGQAAETIRIQNLQQQAAITKTRDAAAQLAQETATTEQEEETKRRARLRGRAPLTRLLEKL